MNVNFVTIADSVVRPVERATLGPGDEKCIENSINKHSNHPSIKLIHKHPEHHNNISFKHLNPSEVRTIFGKLNTKKAMGCDDLTATRQLQRLVPSIKRTVSWTITTIDL